MKNKLKAGLKSAIRNKYVLGGAALIIIIALFFAFRGGSKSTESIAVKRGEFVKTVSVSGKVIAAQSVDLSFETGGTVSYVGKRSGDEVSQGQVIASLSSGDIQADRDKAQADLEAAQAELLKLRNSSSIDSQTDADKQKLINSIISAYTKSDDAVHNKVDQYFRDPALPYPRILYNYYDHLNKDGEMSANRAEIEKTLSKFEDLITGLTVHTYSSMTLSGAKEYLGAVKYFLDRLSPAVNTFEVGGSLTQTMADKYKNDLSTARFNINESIENITSFESALQGSVADIGVEEARVKAAEASVRGYNAELAKRSIVAPFSGILSRQDAKVGQAVGGNESVAALISRNLEVEVYVPEVSLPGMAVGNNATVVMDAYPDETFDAKVIHIDPAETQKDGVSNYKVRLSLENTKGAIVSGLTSDVYIETERRPDIVSLPVRSVVTEDAKTYIYKKQDKDYVKTEVTLGAKDGKGSIEVLSGAAEGDMILVNPPQA